MTDSSTSAKRLVFISEQTPWPLTSGGNIRTFFVLKALARKYQVTLLTSSNSEVDMGAADTALRALGVSIRYCERRKERSAVERTGLAAKTFITGKSLFLANNANPEFARSVEELVRSDEVDLIHCNHLDTVQNVPHGCPVPYAVDTHNVMFEYFERRAENAPTWLQKQIFRAESARLRTYEVDSLKAASLVVVCSEDERDTLARERSDLVANVVPNGVDLTRFSSWPEQPFTHPSTLVFVGDMAYEPNNDGARWMIEEVMPTVSGAVPEAKLQVVGRNPSRELRALAEARADVQVTGEVDDVNEYLLNARAVVVPLRFGSGTRLKVVEAMASGIPIVSTTLGAEGVGCVGGEHLLYADAPDEFATQLKTLFGDQQAYDTLRRNARTLVEERYDWKSIGEQIISAYAAAFH